MKRIDANDLFIVTGLALLAVGVGIYSVPAALVVVGSVLFWLGVTGAMRKAGP